MKPEEMNRQLTYLEAAAGFHMGGGASFPSQPTLWSQSIAHVPSDTKGNDFTSEYTGEGPSIRGQFLTTVFNSGTLKSY